MGRAVFVRTQAPSTILLMISVSKAGSINVKAWEQHRPQQDGVGPAFPRYRKGALVRGGEET